MFSKVLIANRGEIACRIIRTLDKMGIKSVAVYSEVDAHAQHVSMAGESVSLGAASARESYLNIDKILAAATSTGAEAIHPGYGFLSENAEFAQSCEDHGLVFIGPTPGQMRDFGLKHTARALAAQNQVPLLPGTGLLDSVQEAVLAAEPIGYPVMLKSTAGGGGIGMQVAASSSELSSAFEKVQRLSQSNFKQGGLYLEKYVQSARHIEVQIFGDGQGRVLALGERDCSAQRRNQKVIEETPASGLSPSQRENLFTAAEALGRAVSYRSAGTVEFVFDADEEQFYFLEVNTRLQVEHGVTEEVTGIDLVEWMIQTAAGQSPDLSRPRPTAEGHSIQVRIYAEDPGKSFQPSCGLLTEVFFPSQIRCDHWIQAGTEVSPYYDPLLAKVIVKAENRDSALLKLSQALAQTRLAGIETNLDYLQAVLTDPIFVKGQMTTQTLGRFHPSRRTIDVLAPGTFTTVQDYPGRIGYWAVGVPPSGPMDSLAHRQANRILGNPESATTLECTVVGPTLQFNRATELCLTGARMTATLDGVELAYYQPVSVASGSILKLGPVVGPGMRTILAVAGGFDVPVYLGSRSTFTLGQFGGHGGRILRVGDVLKLFPATDLVASRPCEPLPSELIPHYGVTWDIGVMYGPHAAPDFFTPQDMEMFFSTDWEVHYNSARTGVRLIGPKPEWARTDGGEAGLHPSNIHDNAYAIGAIDFTGDMPVILGPDGPSLGGFVCPATVIQAELWKIGQLKPGDRIRFHCLEFSEALAREKLQDSEILTFQKSSLPLSPEPENTSATRIPADARLWTQEPLAQLPSITYRPAGDKYLLVEYGPIVLDLNLRFRVHALMSWLETHPLSGVLDLTPGIRSLQIHYDSRLLSQSELMLALQQAEIQLPPLEEMEVPTRRLRLPLSWEDPSTLLTIQKYMQSVRKDAPWCPSNIEFIRRINGLDSIQEVQNLIFEARYLVMGLGDVYLGAPVATPLDPRHRLVTTKYNPARTWTPDNVVGIGGAYLCIYGMEGPGGYQLFGRTAQVWNRYNVTADFVPGKPWLLRFFDQIQFYPVSAQELTQFRENFIAGKVKLEVEEDTFRLKDYQAFLRSIEPEIIQCKHRQQSAFEEERERWALSKSTESSSLDIEREPSRLEFPEGTHYIPSGLSANVWKVLVKEGEEITQDQPVIILESMKMEISIVSPLSGKVLGALVSEGQMVTAGQNLIAVAPSR